MVCGTGSRTAIATGEILKVLSVRASPVWPVGSRMDQRPVVEDPDPDGAGISGGGSLGVDKLPEEETGLVFAGRPGGRPPEHDGGGRPGALFFHTADGIDDEWIAVGDTRQPFRSFGSAIALRTLRPGVTAGTLRAGEGELRCRAEFGGGDGSRFELLRADAVLGQQCLLRRERGSPGEREEERDGGDDVGVREPATESLHPASSTVGTGGVNSGGPAPVTFLRSADPP